MHLTSDDVWVCFNVLLPSFCRVRAEWVAASDTLTWPSNEVQMERSKSHLYYNKVRAQLVTIHSRLMEGKITMNRMILCDGREWKTEGLLVLSYKD